MRKLMWLTVGFVMACVIGVYVTSGNWLLLMAGISLAAGVPLFFLKKRSTTVAAVVLLGCVFGFFWLWGYHWFYLDTAKDYDGKTVCTTVTVSDYSFETDYGIAADGKIVLENETYNIRIYLVGEGFLAPGDKVTGDIHLRMTLHGSNQPSTYHEGNGTVFLGYVQEGHEIVPTEKTLPENALGPQLRHDILKMIDDVFPSDTAAFAKALLLGEHYDLTYEQDTAFKLSGIRHVIAVSGLHIAILFSLVYTLSGHHRFLTALIGIPVLILFAAVAGFTPSVVRACIMQILIMIALMCNREYDPPTALAAAVLLMLLYNPITITSVSFQLSVGCMVGIFLFSSKIHDYLLRGKRKEAAKGKTLKAKLIRWVVGSVSVTVGAMLTTTPLSAYYFGAVSLVGVVTNILTLWAVSFAFYGIMLSVILGAIYAPLGMAVAWVISFLMRYVMAAATLLSKLPLAAVYTCGRYIVIWLAFAYAVILIFFFSKRKQPVLLFGCLFVSLLLAVAASYVEPLLDDYRITVLDVGQGQCVIFQSREETYVVDCGGDDGANTADKTAQYLLSQGIRRIDGIFLTHYDEDHAGGVPGLLTQLKVETLYLPDIEDVGELRKTIVEQADCDIQWVRQQTQIKGREFTVTMYPSSEGANDNENSLCVLFQREKYDILITGDRNRAGETALLQQADLPKLELLIVGHHGANNATGFELLYETKPTAAVISVGADNFYGHPAAEVLERLSLFGTKVYRTDLHGTIIFRG